MQTTIQLPPPQIDLEFPLMKALMQRRSIRKWKDEPLSDQDLSNLLWAACGITLQETNRSKSRRTAPSASNSQVIKVYVTKQDGLFLYEEKHHRLIQIHSKNLMEHIGTQKMMHAAPLGLIYVSDYSKMRSYIGKEEHQKLFVSGTDAGFISENVYLYCTAANLSTVVLGLVNREKLHELMGLQAHEKVIYSQVVGKAV